MVDESRVRYVHYGNFHPLGDFFKFRVTALSQTTPDEYMFNVTVAKVEVTLQVNSELRLVGALEGKITSQHLRSASSISSHTPQQIAYSIVVPPQHGALFRLESSTGSGGKTKVGSRGNTDKRGN
jgi:hypothetical protein